MVTLFYGTREDIKDTKLNIKKKRDFKTDQIDI